MKKLILILVVLLLSGCGIYTREDFCTELKRGNTAVGYELNGQKVTGTARLTLYCDDDSTKLMKNTSSTIYYNPF
jgi:uncharacterized protein YceK